MIARFLAAMVAAVTPAAAIAAPSVSLGSAVFVEHARSNGSARVRTLEPARKFAPGDRVVTILSWTRTSGDGGFTVVNPVPRGLEFEQSADDSEQVSADGGRTWGRLGMLRHFGRLATAEDVTHVRWYVPAVKARAGTGRIAYSGYVRR